MEKQGSLKYLMVGILQKAHQESSAAQTGTLLMNTSSDAAAIDLSLCLSFPNHTLAVALPSSTACSSCVQENQKELSSFLCSRLVSSQKYAKVEKSQKETHVCTELSLSISSSFSDGQNKVDPSHVSNKRKPSPNPPKNAVKKTRGSGRIQEEMQWGYSTDLKLYEDPWKIKKALTESDLGSLCRLLLATDLVEKLVLPVLGVDAKRDANTLEKGIQIGIWDVDTETMHYLILKYWVSSKSYVLIGRWNSEFVKRRCLKKGDEIGLHFDPYKLHFDLSVLKRATRVGC